MSFRKKVNQEDKNMEEIIDEAFDEKVFPKRELIKNYTAKDLISSGSTLLNLACSDMIDGAYMLGSMVNLIGDSSTGKSLLALSLMAEATKDKRFDKYKLVYDEPEAAMNFPLESMFGKDISRVEFVPKDRTSPRTVQDWHDDRRSWYVDAKKSLIEITDSWDALSTQDDLKSTEAPTKGGWKTEKAIVASITFPKIIGLVQESKSLQMIISQTRANIGVMFGPPKTAGGGLALEFYATHRIWLSKGSAIRVKIRGKDRDIGMNVKVKVKKNKLTGKVRDVSFPIYYEYGVDDIGSMIDWMVEEKFWGKEKGGKIITEGDFIDGKHSNLVEQIENDNLEGKLKQIVGECWKELENEISIRRKPKY